MEAHEAEGLFARVVETGAWKKYLVENHIEAIELVRDLDHLPDATEIVRVLT